MQELLDESNYYLNKAKIYFKINFSLPEIIFYNSGPNAGFFDSQKNKIGYNTKLFIFNRKDFIKNTIPHEIAHYVSFVLYGTCKHDTHWKDIMLHVFGREAKIYHNYDLSIIKRKNPLKKWIYNCSCENKDLLLSTKSHNRIKKGLKYHCTTCKSNLKFSGDFKFIYDY